MAKKVDEVLSFTGNIEHVVSELSRRLQKRGQSLAASLVHLTRSENAPALEQIAGILIQLSLQGFRVTVDYSQPLERMVALGRYSYCGDITSDRFPIKRNGGIKQIIVKLVGFDDEYIHPSHVLERLNSERMRPATIEELLAFGAQCPRDHARFLVVALGAVSQKSQGKVFAGLDFTNGGRFAGVVAGSFSSSEVRFLAVLE